MCSLEDIVVWILISFNNCKRQCTSPVKFYTNTFATDVSIIVSVNFWASLVLLDSSSADLRINENCCSDIVCTYRFTSPSGNGHETILYQIRKCNLNRPIPKSMNFLSKKVTCKNIERLLRKMSVNLSQKNVSFVAGHVNDVMRNAY